MTETGIIEKIIKGYATVKFDRKTACESCRMCMKHKDDMSVCIFVKNSLDANVGDKVVVEMSNAVVLKSAFVVYFIPIILIAIALLLTLSFNEVVQFIAMSVALAMGVVICILVEKYNKKYNKISAIMVKIIREDDNNGINNIIEK